MIMGVSDLNEDFLFSYRYVKAIYKKMDVENKRIQIAKRQ